MGYTSSGSVCNCRGECMVFVQGIAIIACLYLVCAFFYIIHTVLLCTMIVCQTKSVTIASFVYLPCGSVSPHAGYGSFDTQCMQSWDVRWEPLSVFRQIRKYWIWLLSGWRYSSVLKALQSCACSLFIQPPHIATCTTTICYHTDHHTCIITSTATYNHHLTVQVALMPVEHQHKLQRAKTILGTSMSGIQQPNAACTRSISQMLCPPLSQVCTLCL